MIVHARYCRARLSVAGCLMLLAAHSAFGQAPPVLNTVFPAGVQSGQSVEVTASGSNLQGLQSVRCNSPGVRCEPLEQPTRFRLTIPADTPPGLYDLWAVGDNGVSAPRTFAIGNRAEQLELEPNETVSDAMPVPLDVVINGQLDKAADADHFRFEAKRGQRVVIECWAERIDSRLRAVLEVFDAAGRRLGVNRGYFGIDPLIDFRVPADGSYVVKLHDLVSSGSAEHYYRLDIDTGPRVAFAVPSVVQRGQASRVALYGWNLADQREGEAPAEPRPEEEHGSAGVSPSLNPHDPLDRVEVDIPATLAEAAWPLRVPLHPSQAVLAGAAFPFHLPGSHAPVVIGITDVPVVVDRADNHSPSSAQEIVVPCEVSGQLIAGDERDWFAIDARRGEVLYIEALGQRIHSPVDLQISVLVQSGTPVSGVNNLESRPGRAGHTLADLRELVQFGDEVRNIGGAFPTCHLDPAGRWVCPADGRYLIAVWNLIGGLHADPRRTYRLSVRREEPDFQIVAVPRGESPAGINVRRDGREVLDLLAFRRRGCDGSIRVSAKDLPAGLDCPDVWLGPGVDRATVVVSADRDASALFGELKLEGFVGEANPSATLGGRVVRAGTPKGWGRITSQMPLAVAGDAPLRITADAHETLDHHLYGTLPAKHSPGGVVDIAIQIERRDAGHQAPVKLIGVGLPELIQNQTASIPAGQQKGYLSFYLPSTLPVGRYSLVIRAETTVPTTGDKTETVAVFSNPVTLDVQPAAFLVEVDPFAVTRAKRGEIIQIAYSAQRRNGFIGKMHTELAAPGCITDVVGLRGRGETFVGQTDKGSLQIIVNDDAPLGRQSFLRLFTVGVVEDEPVFFGSSFLALEIVE